MCPKSLFQKVVQKNVGFIRREAKRKAVLTSLPTSQVLFSPLSFDNIIRSIIIIESIIEISEFK